MELLVLSFPFAFLFLWGSTAESGQLKADFRCCQGCLKGTESLYSLWLLLIGPRRYTRSGYEKARVPQDLWWEIQQEYETIGEDAWKPEPCYRGAGIYACHVVSDDGDECSLADAELQLLWRISDQLSNRINTELKPLAESWANGVELSFNAVFGFRRYVRGAKVEGHTDVFESKVISAIINVAQDTDGHPWPLEILDHEGLYHQVFMEPGDLVWYESAKLPHGREEIFRGNFYVNLFVHFYPAWYHNATSDEIMFANTTEINELDIYDVV